jgi:hypothetical protein
MSERIFGRPPMPDDETNEPEDVIDETMRRPGLGEAVEERDDDDEQADESDR